MRTLAIQCPAVSEPRSSPTCVLPPKGRRTVILYDSHPGCDFCERRPVTRCHYHYYCFADAPFSELEWIRPTVFEDYSGIMSDSTVEANRRALISTEFRDKRNLRISTLSVQKSGECECDPMGLTQPHVSPIPGCAKGTREISCGATVTTMRRRGTRLLHSLSRLTAIRSLPGRNGWRSGNTSKDY